MNNSQGPPQGKLARSLVGGKTAARVGGAVIGYAAKRPFLSAESRKAAKLRMTEKSADALFGGLCQLKGTALKLAQMLSLELDVFPEEVRSRLERSYNDVPPLNRALVRKVLKNAYGGRPETVLKNFDAEAFAAASLGQVHRAVSIRGEDLALKIQYPGIRESIHSDMQMLKAMFRPFAEYEVLLPVLEEVEQRLTEETNYKFEADNLAFFKKNMRLHSVATPEPHYDLTSERVLCLSMLRGTPLNAWLKTMPAQEDRDRVAQTLQDLFIHGLYEMHCIHADPNPGNFIVMDDGRVGLVDFGCIKHLDKDFVALYQKLPLASVRNDVDCYFETLCQLKLIPADHDEALDEEVREISRQFGVWLRRLFDVDVFDFSRETDFVQQGKAITTAMKKTLRRMRMNPEFVFLDRTRYGLLRLFETMGARVSFRNAYEWEGMK